MVGDTDGAHVERTEGIPTETRDAQPDGAGEAAGTAARGTSPEVEIIDDPSPHPRPELEEARVARRHWLAFEDAERQAREAEA